MIFFSLGILFLVWIVSAWNWLSSRYAENWDSLDFSKYNELVSWSITTKWYINTGSWIIWWDKNIASVTNLWICKAKITFINPYLNTNYKFLSTVLTWDYTTVNYSVDIFEKSTDYITVLAQKSDWTNYNMSFDFIIIE